ncbi:MAG: 50S ribosomal protein L13 [Terricaulis sp.]
MRTQVTRSAKAADVTHNWIVVDAAGAVVGRLASFVALRLRGKHRADFTPNTDVGDHVVIINAGKVAFTGRKLERKVYHWHTGYPGGIKERTAGKILDGKHPERIMEKAIERMMPKESPLARKQLGKLRVYAGSEHPHAAQNPATIDFKSFNRKNSRVG